MRSTKYDTAPAVLVSATTGMPVNPTYKLGALFVDNNRIIIDQTIEPGELHRLKQRDMPYGSNVMHSNLLGQLVDSLNEKTNNKTIQKNNTGRVQEQIFDSQVQVEAPKRTHTYSLRSRAKSQGCRLNQLPTESTSEKEQKGDDGAIFMEQPSDKTTSEFPSAIATKFFSKPLTPALNTLQNDRDSVLNASFEIFEKMNNDQEIPVDKHLKEIPAFKGYVFAEIATPTNIPTDAIRYSVTMKLVGMPEKEIQYIIIGEKKFPIILRKTHYQRLSYGRGTELGKIESTYLNKPKNIIPAKIATTTICNPMKRKAATESEKRKKQQRLNPPLTQITPPGNFQEPVEQSYSLTPSQSIFSNSTLFSTSSLANIADEILANEHLDELSRFLFNSS